MTQSHSRTPPYPNRPLRNIFKPAVTIMAIIVLFMAGFIAVSYYAGQTRSNAFASWEGFLKRSAKQDSANVTEWINQQYAVLSGISSNISLQIYMTELALGGKSMVTDEAAQAAYLRKLLIATAKREGFTHGGGLALLDKEGKVVASTSRLRRLDSHLMAFVNGNTENQVEGPYINKENHAVIAFKLPVHVVQGGPEEEAQQIGMVVGLREVRSGLYPLFNQAPTKEASLISLVIRPMGNMVEYYLPDALSESGLAKRLPLTREELAVVYAVQHPEMMVVKKDLQAEKVLAVAARVPSTDWYIVKQVKYSEAVQLANYINFLVVATYSSVFLAVLVLVLAVMAFKGRRSLDQECTRYKRISEKLSIQRNILDNILNTLPMAIMFTDEHGNRAYANRRASRLDANQILSELNRYYQEHWHGYVKDAPVISFAYQGDSAIKSTHFPVDANSQGFEGKGISGVLTIEEDVTLLFAENRMLGQVLAMLSTLSAAQARYFTRSKVSI